MNPCHHHDIVLFCLLRSATYQPVQKPTTMIVSTIRISALAALFTTVCNGFSASLSNSRQRRKPVGLSAQRLICEFEASDFSLATGEWPYTTQDLSRLDNSKDDFFYDTPRFVTHIDDRAIESLTNFYREEMAAVALKKKTNVDVLDLCSSWISHLPDDDIVPFGKVVGIGMNQQELEANKQLTDYFVQDLNENPKLEQLEDASFDVICNVVSVDYLTKPKEIFQEMHRILRPGGLALMSFSNRCFPSKAVNMWLQADDIGRMTIVGSYFHYTAKWNRIEALDILPEKVERPKAPSMTEILQNPSSGFAWMTTAAAVQKQNTGDPMFVVKAVK
ncbi:Methyltransferase domain [Seminavis robusta]|uniref:Methyltransferase domain n=1 Tax=Seminavis robusta TaxID=568900 RepID=A0A9N8ETJ5_9STRA|nr:Methyltransferase domain [Seminavis robusta]|eukprot:Sro1647_g288400.1 Methyltransferase domain (333) ;mRNA; r:15469-16467